MSSKQYFDDIAPKWNEIRSEYFRDELREKILENADIENKVVGDFGCGTGFISLGLAAKNPSIIFSIDQSINMLRELKKESIRKGYKNVYPVKSSLDELVIFDESIDVITINMALHHVVDAEKAVKEMYRVLKKGGNLIISDVYEHSGEWAKIEMYDEWLGFSNNQIMKWLDNSGFKNISIKNTGLQAKGYSSKGEYTETDIFIATAKK
ncbi:methyltransferase domain-containing protein [Clostridium sp. SHJSY1]|uniref:class I SAM-dependent methyltransferase n=1 Tax=Clostridium sp. SHJSY1 TaxID=2942483 RepID=UPI00287720FB|nr:methyltransferase domain-containing protein [Clostridium sp. SHJSY1]MDS0526419.1 methyltransferase domain-containing protein [Clostridium sp. SHJSY1]